MTRRDKLHLAAKRASLLSFRQCGAAWVSLARELDKLGEMDLPKFKHLFRAIRRATISAKHFV